MSITTTTHLNFRGDARAALEFYQGVFGGDLTIVTHAQAYPVHGPDEADLVSWGQVQAPNGFHVMAYDVPAGRSYDAGDAPIFVSVRGTDPDEVTTFWKGSPTAPRSSRSWARPAGRRSTACSGTASA